MPILLYAGAAFNALSASHPAPSAPAAGDSPSRRTALPDLPGIRRDLLEEVLPHGASGPSLGLVPTTGQGVVDMGLLKGGGSRGAGGVVRTSQSQRVMPSAGRTGASGGASSSVTMPRLGEGGVRQGVVSKGLSRAQIHPGLATPSTSQGSLPPATLSRGAPASSPGK